MADTAVYEFNARNASPADPWDTNPANMIDGTYDSYAETDSTGDEEELTANECDGTDLGTISAVELRAYGYGDGGDWVYLKPVFGGSDAGDDHTVLAQAGAAWSAWQDITTDTNAPDWSSWTQIQDLDCRAEYIKDGKANTMYCGMVQVQVTYDPPSGDVTVDAVTATATAAGLVPIVTGDALVSGELATAAAAGLVPVVMGGTGVTVSAVLATAVAAGLVPTVTADALILGVLAAAAAAGLIPTVTGGATVSGEIATATAAGLVPTVTGDALITSGLAQAVAAGLAPTVTGEGDEVAPSIVILRRRRL